jgi:hypothetical protein
MSRATAADYYRSIAEELSDPRTTLADLDTKVVAAARAWAKRSHQAWPPKPATSGWQITTWSR